MLPSDQLNLRDSDFYSNLADRDYTVTVFNPLQIRAYSQVGICKTKTDRANSQYIADFLHARVGQTIHVRLVTFV